MYKASDGSGTRCIAPTYLANLEYAYTPDNSMSYVELSELSTAV